MQKDKHVQYNKYVHALKSTNGAWMRCLKWTRVQSLAKRQTCPDMALQHNWTGHLWYDMTHALIILSEVTVGIVQDAPYSVSKEDLLRMVGMFWGNSVCPSWQQRIKLHGEEDQAHWLQMCEWCQMMDYGEDETLQKIPCFNTCLWAKHYWTHTETGKKMNSERETETETETKTQRELRCYPMKLLSSNSRQRETEEERK